MFLGGSATTISALFLLTSSWLIITTQTVVIDFIDYPGNVTVPLDNNVTLECIANQTALAWNINNKQLLDTTAITPLIESGVITSLTSVQTVSDGYNGITITIPANVFTNETIVSIICQAGPSNFALQDGDIITFTVYGYPLAPGELIVSGDIAHQLNLSWSPPFTLPGEIISYYILIQDVVTGQNESINSLTDTNYIHQLTETDPILCHHYLFSISSVNDVGFSQNSSSAPPVLHPSGPGPLGVVETVVQHNSSHAMNGTIAILTLIFKRPQSCFPLIYTISLYDVMNGNTPLVMSTSDNNDDVIITIPGLREYARYSFIISVYNNFSFSINNPIDSDSTIFVTSGLQSVSVVHYENETLKIMCIFAEGSKSTGCQVMLTIDSVTTTTIDIDRHEDAIEVVHFDTTTRGVPSLVEAQDIGVTSPLVISGSIMSEGDPSYTTSILAEMSTSYMTPDATPTITSSPSSGLNILTWAIPAGVGVAILMLLVLLACCLVCCKQRNSKYHIHRHDTLPHGLHVPHSPTSPTTSHDYKQVTHHSTATIKEMSFNPLYGDAPPQKIIDPPLPSVPSNGSAVHDTITLPSDLPPVYEEVSAAKQAAKLAANPQYGAVGGAVGGANGGTLNPQYSTPPGNKPPSEDHMYASLKEPGHLSTDQKMTSLQYAQPYEHVRLPNNPGGVVNSSQTPPTTEGVTISTNNNVSYNVPSTSPPQKSL